MLKRTHISFSCELKNLSLVREFVRTHLVEYGVTYLTQEQIVLAIDEVCANLIVHSNQSNPHKKIELALSLVKTPKGVSIEFIEEGTPFDYQHYIEPNLEELIDSKSSGKMGLMLVRRIMDEIQYIREGNQNICRLYKSLT